MITRTVTLYHYWYQQVKKRRKEQLFLSFHLSRSFFYIYNTGINYSIKRREESDTYPTHVCRHPRSGDSPENVYSWWRPQCWLKAPHILSFLWAIFAMMTTDVSLVIGSTPEFLISVFFPSNWKVHLYIMHLLFGILS